MAVKPAGVPLPIRTSVLPLRGKPRGVVPNAVSALADRRVSCGLSSAQWPAEIARRFRSVTAERSPAFRRFPRCRVGVMTDPSPPKRPGPATARNQLFRVDKRATHRCFHTVGRDVYTTGCRRVASHEAGEVCIGLVTGLSSRLRVATMTFRLSG